MTVTSEDAPRQNAGGESSAGGDEPAVTEPTETETVPEGETETMPEETETGEHEDAEAAAASYSDSGEDWVARWLAFIGVGCAFAAIAFALLRRPRGDEGGPSPPAGEG